MPRHIRTLPEVDDAVSLNIYQCSRCDDYWVDVFTPDYGYRSWKSIPADDLAVILHTHNEKWIKLWAANRDLIP